MVVSFVVLAKLCWFYGRHAGMLGSVEAFGRFWLGGKIGFSGCSVELISIMNTN